MADEADQPAIVLDEEAKALQLEQAKAEARKAIIDANLATAKAMVPTIDTTGLKQSVKLDEKAGSLVNAVAAGELKEAASAIAKLVSEQVAAGSRVILVEGRSVADADVVYEEFTARLTWFETEFETILTKVQEPPPPAREAVPLVPMLLAASAVSSLVTTTLGLMGSDVSVSGRSVSLDDTALKAVLAGELKRLGRVPVIEGLMSVDDTQVVTRFNGLWNKYSSLKEKAADRRAELDPRSEELAGLDARVAAVQASYDEAVKGGDAVVTARIASQLKEAQETRNARSYSPEERKLLKLLDRATWLLTTFDAFAVAATTVPAGAPRSALQAAALRELVQARNAGDHLLFATITASGGDVVVKEPRLPTSTHTKFIAGVVVTYILVDAQGTIATADLTTHYGEKDYKL